MSERIPRRQEYSNRDCGPRQWFHDVSAHFCAGCHAPAPLQEHAPTDVTPAVSPARGDRQSPSTRVLGAQGPSNPSLLLLLLSSPARDDRTPPAGIIQLARLRAVCAWRAAATGTWRPGKEHWQRSCQWHSTGAEHGPGPRRRRRVHRTVAPGPGAHSCADPCLLYAVIRRDRWQPALRFALQSVSGAAASNRHVHGGTCIRKGPVLRAIGSE